MSILATCATIGALLAAAQGGEHIELMGQDCPRVTISRTYSPSVTIEADGSTVRGLDVRGGGLDWRGGTLVAAKGPDGVASDGYAAQIRSGARDVSFIGVTFTDARIGLVIGAAERVTVDRSRFTGLRVDGFNAAGVRGLTVTRSLFADPRPRPTQCHTASTIQLGLSRRACEGLGGAWRDGDHPDAGQLRDGVTDVLLEHNLVLGPQQGLNIMATAGDAPNVRVAIRRNTIATDNPHKATLTDCEGCAIVENVVTRPPGSTWKAIIIPGPAVRCGNVEQDAARPELPCT